MNLLTATPAEFCSATRACAEGWNWAVAQPDMAAVWDNCPRPDWMMWVLDRLGQPPDARTLRLYAVWCARSTPLPDGRVTGDLLTDPRSLAALEVAERYAEGGATEEELSAAYYYSASAVSAAASSYSASSYSASAAASAYTYSASAAAYSAYTFSASVAYSAYTFSASVAYTFADPAANNTASAASAAYASATFAASAAARAHTADAPYAAACAVYSDARQAQADQLRRMIANPFRKEGGAS